MKLTRFEFILTGKADMDLFTEVYDNYLDAMIPFLFEVTEGPSKGLQVIFSHSNGNSNFLRPLETMELYTHAKRDVKIICCNPRRIAERYPWLRENILFNYESGLTFSQRVYSVFFHKMFVVTVPESFTPQEVLDDLARH